MTDMDVDYTLEQFWVPNLYLKSHERPPKSGRVPDLFLYHLRHNPFLFALYNSSNVYVKGRDIFCHAHITEVDEGINPNPFLNERYCC